MIVAESCYNEMINSTARSIRARVELYDGSTLLDTYTYDGALQDVSVDRIGESSKFFGYGICQKLTVKLRDKERAINITKGQGLEVVVGVGCEYLYTCPIFFVDEVKRDENTNNLTVTAYDALYRAAHHTVNELALPTSYSIFNFATACAGLLGMPLKIERRNLLDLNKCGFGSCKLNSDGSIVSNVNNEYYPKITTTALNQLLMDSKGKSFTFSVGKVIPDRFCTIVIYGNRTSGATYQEANAINTDHVTITVADDFTSISSLELRFNRHTELFTDTTTTIPYIQFESGDTATQYEKYNVSFDTVYPSGANFSGKETIRDALNAVAEATQTIYYMNNNWELTFKRLDRDGAAVLTIDKSKYFSLASKTSHTLSTIVSATELGDDVYATTGVEDASQYIRNNPFWDLRDDIGDLLTEAISVVGGLTITQFECKHRGNFLLEIGDKIDLITKDNDVVTAYLLNDVFTYNGGLVETTKWEFENNDGESVANPSTLGEALKYTYARVDKVNQNIELVASEANANSENIASLRINTDSIVTSVSRVEDNVNSAIESVYGDIATLTNKVESTVTAEDVQLQIQTEISNGVDKVTTSTGFTFNDEGLTVSKSDSDLSTQITEDGLTVYREADAVLTANNTGVLAKNLHATTYLIVGDNSRFENYGSNRTGCFWIGQG